MRRYVSYDIDESNSYSDLYNLLERFGAHKLTESTCCIDSDIPFDIFKQKFREVTSQGDKVIIVFRTKNGINHIVVR